MEAGAARSLAQSLSLACFQLADRDDDGCPLARSCVRLQMLPGSRGPGAANLWRVAPIHGGAVGGARLQGNRNRNAASGANHRGWKIRGESLPQRIFGFDL